MIKMNQLVGFLSFISRKIQFLYYFSFIKLCNKKEGLIIVGFGRSDSAYTRKHIDLSCNDLKKEVEVLTKNIKKLTIKYGDKI